MRITLWFRQNLQNISQTNALHATGVLRYCSVSLKKRPQLRMCHNLGGLVWSQCGRIWKMGPPLRWKMRTPPYVTYPQYLDCFAKRLNAWSTTFTSHVSFLFTFFYFRFNHFSLFFHTSKSRNWLLPHPVYGQEIWFFLFVMSKHTQPIL